MDEHAASERGEPDLRLEISADRREITIHVTPEGIASLRAALDDAEGGGKVFLGDRAEGTGLLIVRPVGWHS